MRLRLPRLGLKLWVGGGLTLALLATALLAPWLAPHSPTAQHLFEGLERPGRAHLLGQDRLGRDILSRILHGTRISVYVGVVTVLLAAGIGTLLGALAGYFRGSLDELLMRLVDIFLAFPGILLAIALMGVLGPSLGNVILALVVMGWVGYARLVRGQVLAARQLDYVTAAQALGARPRRVIARHLLPNVLSPVIVEATFGMAGAILAEAGLSFLGLGVQPPTPSWGSMLNEGRHYLLVAPHLTLFPGFAIMLTILGFNFLGDGLHDLLNPRQRR
ncbi:MAG: ABC transporter permease [Candidatus Tectomicrobia bacterium]|nr:ABC transporter permease [Candidatus Tectomicrobia bacterium]